MADTIKNIVVPAKTVVDIYANAGVIAAGVVVGSRISVKMIGNGNARYYSGLTLASKPTNDTGFTPIYPQQELMNTDGDNGAFIWSEHGCTINVVDSATLPADKSSDILNELLASHPRDGKQALNTEFGELTVGMRIDDISINFHYGISTKDSKDNSTGTGSVSSVASDASVSSGVGIGTGELESIDAVRYRAGHESLSMITHDQTALEAGVDVMHGLLNIEDGIAIGSQGTEKGAWFIEGGNENFIPAASFSVDPLDGTGPSKFNWDITKRNLFMLTFGYLSIAPIRYYIATGDGWSLFHTINLINQQNVGHLKNPTLPLSMRVRRLAGSGSDVQVKTGSWRGGTVGPEHQVNASDRWYGSLANRVNLSAINIGVTPDLFHNMLTLKSTTIFNSKPNHIRSELAVVTFVVDANKGVEFVGLINGALVGNDAFIDKDTLNSVISISINGTVEGPTSGASTILGRISSQRTNVKGTGIYIRPGQDFTIGGRGINGSAVTGDISVSIRWIEEF